MFFLKRKVSLGMYMFYIVVINKQNYCFGRKNSIASRQKDSAFLLYYFWEKNTVMEIMFRTRKKSTNAMLLGSSVHSFIS